MARIVAVNAIVIGDFAMAAVSTRARGEIATSKTSATRNWIKRRIGDRALIGPRSKPPNRMTAMSPTSCAIAAKNKSADTDVNHGDTEDTEEFF